MLDHHAMMSQHHQPQTPHHTIHMTDSETISISIGVGADARTASSIVLPRGHDLVKHLERLIPAMTKTVEAAAYQQHQYQQQPQPQQYSNAAPRSYDVHRTHTHAHHPYQHHPQPQRQEQYFHQQELPHSPYHSDASSSNGSTTAPSSASSGSLNDNHMMQQQYAGVRRRRGPTGGQGAGKKCQFPNCEKISVSRGLCRGHGGGRRCQHEGCSKGAQSRSDFCWAHGGGQRCEVKNCMRSRKSKRFCVAHLSWEGVVSLADGASHHQDITATTSHRAYEQPKAIMPKLLAPAYHPEAAPISPPSTAISFPTLSMSAKLPSLQQALRKNLCVNAASVSHTAQRPSGFTHQQTAA